MEINKPQQTTSEFQKSILNQDTTHLLFLNPSDPSQSFKFEITSETEDTYLMAELMNHIAKETNTVYKISDIFGNKINKNETVHYYKNLQPFYIEQAKPKCTEFSEFNISVKSLTSETFELNVNSLMTIADVKRLLFEKDGIPADQKRLIFNREEVEEDVILGDEGIKAGDVLYRVLRLRGGGASGVAFVDITDENKAVVKQWSYGAPLWRTVFRPGLCIEGICTNEECEAYGQWVIASKGTGTYDLILDYDSNQCPVCNEPIQPGKCAFNNCAYRYVGTRSVFGAPPQKVMSDKEIVVADHYKLFDSEIAGKAYWFSLKIITKCEFDMDVGKLSKRATALMNNDQAEVCGICCEKIQESGETLDCAHKFHKNCLEKIKHLNIKCSICYM